MTYTLNQEVEAAMIMLVKASGAQTIRQFAYEVYAQVGGIGDKDRAVTLVANILFTNHSRKWGLENDSYWTYEGSS